MTKLLNFWEENVARAEFWKLIFHAPGQKAYWEKNRFLIFEQSI
jgi:hypothetical protein